MDRFYKKKLLLLKFIENGNFQCMLVNLFKHYNTFTMDGNIDKKPFFERSFTVATTLL